MTRDLTLLPFEVNSNLTIAHSALSLHRHTALFAEIQNIENQGSQPAPRKFWSYLSIEIDGQEREGEARYGITTLHRYGKLRYVLVKDLKPLQTHDGIQGHYENRAAWAYLAQLPDDFGVALFWY